MPQYRRIKKKSELIDKQVRSLEVKAAINKEYNRVEKYSNENNETLKILQNLVDNNDSFHDGCGDEIICLEDSWRQFFEDWSILPIKNTQFDVDKVLYQIEEENKYLDELIFKAGYLTIPERTKKHLETERVGQGFDFHEAFKDELPSFEGRLKILEFMRINPIYIDGIVDVKNGMIYRASPEKKRRNKSYRDILILLVVGLFIIWVVSIIGYWIQDWFISPSRTKELIVGYIFVIIGGISHVIVDALKQARSTKESNMIVLEDWFFWIHVKESQIMMGIFSLLVGTLGLAFFSQKVDWQTAFLVGYSIDSFIDLFLQRFDSVISSKTQVAKEKYQEQPSTNTTIT